MRYWIVGSSYGGTDDQYERFIKEGIWNVNTDRYANIVNSVKVEDRIAIKSLFTQKKNLPFDNRGHFVSVMNVKAIGTIEHNPKNGRELRVKWDIVHERPRSWFFRTYRKAIAPIDDDQELVDFVFNDQEQDIDKFKNLPQFRERFGDKNTSDHSCVTWTPFFEELATKLPDKKNNQHEIINKLNNLLEKAGAKVSVEEGEIDPFTIYAAFNRSAGGPNTKMRQTVAAGLKEYFQLDADVPNDYSGVPVAHSMNAWFLAYKRNRKEGDSENLWRLFDCAIHLPESHDDYRDSFIQCFDGALGQHTIGLAKLTTGLYWISPWNYVPLDKNSRGYIARVLKFNLPEKTEEINGKQYLDLVKKLNIRFEELQFPVHSFPELSYKAFLWKNPEDVEDKESRGGNDEDDENGDSSINSKASEELNTYDHLPEIVRESYSVRDIISDGSFLSEDELVEIVAKLKSKKNVILQGPPGTGKTWLAKKIAYALMGYKNDRQRLLNTQFHPHYSYEDFIRGYRPKTGEKESSLVLEDGPLLSQIKRAINDPQGRYVCIVEEINRGNPIQIFGELLTLIEADKRSPNEAMTLIYSKNDEIYVPENMYFIGTMNRADRSIAILDVAFRRRFAFHDLTPCFNSTWMKWVSEKNKELDLAFLKSISEKITQLNKEIAKDDTLGPQFEVGHSYFTPAFTEEEIKDKNSWYERIIKSEIRPLLQEYWNRDEERVDSAITKLLND